MIQRNHFYQVLLELTFRVKVVVNKSCTNDSIRCLHTHPFELHNYKDYLTAKNLSETCNECGLNFLIVLFRIKYLNLDARFCALTKYSCNYTSTYKTIHLHN